MSRSSLVGAAVLALALTGCSSTQDSSDPRAAAPGDQEQASETVAPLRITTSLTGRQVAVDQTLEVSASGGRLRKVAVTSDAGPLAGSLARDGSSWTAGDRLEPGLGYDVRTVGERSDGKRVVETATFTTEDLTLAEQTYASVAPLEGETVGIGMPVIVTFDVPVTDRASMERHMRVESTPAQVGSWHWLSDTEVHWRPRTYWKAGTDVAVDLDINSVAAGGGVYGQEDRDVDFRVGDAHVYKVNTQTQQMQVFSNGDLLRTLPVTTGKAGFTTRSGTKVIVEKYREKRMNSETVGIGQNDPEFYDIDDVEYAMRLTYTGEFIHAAPWSVGSQGNANVSHGCTGMSTADAAYLYNMTVRGDVVEYTGTDRPMTLTNGFGDWNVDFATWSKGSALS